MSGLLIVGAGGHGKVVADAARLMKRWDRLAFLDDRYPSISSVFGCPVLGTIPQAPEFIEDYPDLAVAIGDNETRINLISMLNKAGFVLPSIIHPSAVVSESVRLGAGSVVFAQAAVNVDATIGMGAIINTGATVDHDCVLGKGVHLSPGVHLAGGVNIGDFSWIGIGATVIQGITVGERVTVGAGAVVHQDVDNNVRVAGVPAKVLKSA
jgi:sugar O-acyltransferase (sialic acid O-acetyltransferase NeuD family)